jgi:iron complex transport system substrate-binding protein
MAINLQAIDSLVALGVKPIGYAEPGGEPVNYLGKALEGIAKVGSHSKPSLESIAALQPDLIIIDSSQQKDLIPELQKIAPVLGIRSTSYQETMEQLKLVGDIVEKKAEAEKFAADFDGKIKAYIAKAGGKQGPKVQAIFGSEQKPGLWLGKSFVGSILSALNGQHAYSGPADPDYPDLVYTSLEKILESNPQVLLMMSTPGKELSKAFAANPAFKNTDAVKTNRVHEVDRQSWSRSRGPVAATQILDQAFPLLYPEAK